MKALFVALLLVTGAMGLERKLPYVEIQHHPYPGKHSSKKGGMMSSSKGGSKNKSLLDDYIIVFRRVTFAPTMSPTGQSAVPTIAPTDVSLPPGTTAAPTTVAPSTLPPGVTAAPTTLAPTLPPGTTAAPTTATPTLMPTVERTDAPREVDSPSPTISIGATEAPTLTPQVTPAPTIGLFATPAPTVDGASGSPSVAPSVAGSPAPTADGTGQPSGAPSVSPAPTIDGFVQPSGAPSATPSAAPSVASPTTEAPQATATATPTIDLLIVASDAPSAVPTAVPQDNIVAAREVTTKPLTFRASGMVDLASREEDFFAAVQEVLVPYVRANAEASGLQLAITFLQSESDVETSATGVPILVRSYFDVRMILDVMDSEDEMTEDSATVLLSSFFSGTSLNRLLLILDRDYEISVGSIVPVSKSSIPGANVPVPVVGNDDRKKGTPTTPTGSSTSMAMVASLMAIVIVIAIAVASVFYTRKRRIALRSSIAEGDDSGSGSSFSGESATGFFKKKSTILSRIKPAALQARRKREQVSDSYSVSEDSKDTDSNYEMSVNPVSIGIAGARVISDVEKGLPQSMQTKAHKEEDLVEEAEQRLSKDPHVASTSLTCLDDKGPAEHIQYSYPEFEMFSHIPKSPVWSPGAGLTPVSPDWSAGEFSEMYALDYDHELGEATTQEVQEENSKSLQRLQEDMRLLALPRDFQEDPEESLVLEPQATMTKGKSSRSLDLD